MKNTTITCIAVSLIISTGLFAQEDRTPAAAVTQKDLNTAFDLYKKRLSEGGNPVLQFNSSGATLTEQLGIDVPVWNIPKIQNDPFYRPGPKRTGTILQYRARTPNPIQPGPQPAVEDPCQIVRAALEAQIAVQQKLIAALEAELAECRKNHNPQPPNP